MTNEEIIANGRKLFQSAENIRRSAPDLDALLHSLWEAVEETQLFGQIEDLGDEDAGGDQEWLAPSYAFNAVVLSSPKRFKGQKGASKKPKPIGTLTFIARLCNTADVENYTVKWPWLDQACLILGWHPKEHTEYNWEIDNFNPDDESIKAIVHVGNGLWAWQEEGENYAYFFAIPIFALQNENDLQRLALTPLKNLFFSSDPVSAAEEALSGVLALQP